MRYIDAASFAVVFAYMFVPVITVIGSAVGMSSKTMGVFNLVSILGATGAAVFITRKFLRISEKGFGSDSKYEPEEGESDDEGEDDDENKDKNENKNKNDGYEKAL